MILYPSNWLYNAGVIGFLRVLESAGENVENFLKDDGSVNIIDFSKKFLSEVNKVNNYEILKLAHNYLIFNFNEIVSEKANSDEEKIKKVWGKLFNTYYRGFFNANTVYLFQPSKKSPALIEQFSNFIKNMLNSNQNSFIKCSFCLTSNYNFSHKNKFTSEHNKIIGASFGEVPNSFWNLGNSSSLNICDFCSFILLNYHLGLIKLSDNSEIFINAPSFKIMWYLNKYARTLYGKQKTKEIREILGISLIEISSRLQPQLSNWTKMNIEVIVKYKDKIDFFSLPYEVIDVLSDRNIASLLNEIGELKILNMVLDGKFNEILKFGERVFRIAIKLKNERGKHEKDFINENVKLKKNKEDLISFSQKLFKLYALIEEKVKMKVLI
ncbi:MAG: hypothetical protein ABIL76_01995 [candidate division WOR-3 bacterium]